MDRKHIGRGSDGSGRRVLIFQINIKFSLQCSKLKVHPASCVHILAAGCIDFANVQPVCACFA